MSEDVLRGQDGRIAVERTSGPGTFFSDRSADGGILYSDKVIESEDTKRGRAALNSRVRGVTKHEGSCTCVTFVTGADGVVRQQGMSTIARGSNDPHCKRCGGLL